MGRKIPGRKHRGVRDPEKQRQVRLSKLKQKINKPPKNADDQPIPKSLLNLMQWKELGKTKETKTKKKQPLVVKNSLFKNSVKKKDSVFVRLPGESDEAFLERIGDVADEEIDIIKTHGIKENQDESADEFDEIVKGIKEDASKRGKKAKGKKNENGEPALTKTQRRRLKEKAKKEQKRNDELEDQVYVVREKIAFGDIVHAPPTLTAPRGVKKTTVARPGVKNLLLKSVLNKQDPHIANKPKKLKAIPIKTLNNVIDRKGKRKDLPNALRRQLDKQQTEIVEAYRMIKKNKNRK